MLYCLLVVYDLCKRISFSKFGQKHFLKETNKREILKYFFGVHTSAAEEDYSFPKRRLFPLVLGV